ncbi:MAG: hypothetical protein K2I20_03685 [Clostridia bacterium]|nr:hypothetical protein [Clostridia bacterium]MDE7214427.1 hypothetical protein [Clostridia bacterium]
MVECKKNCPTIGQKGEIVKEYKTLKLSPYVVNNEIPLQEVFGWKVEQTQEVYSESQEIVGLTSTSVNSGYSEYGYEGNRNTGSSRTNYGIQTRTNVTNYISIRFSRETNMPHYEKLKQLEIDYDTIDSEYKSRKYKDFETLQKPIGLTVFFVFLIIVSVIVAILSFITGKYILLAGLAVGIALIFYTVHIWKIFKKRNEEINLAKKKNEERLQELLTKGSDILKEAKTIIESISV